MGSCGWTVVPYDHCAYKKVNLHTETGTRREDGRGRPQREAWILPATLQGPTLPALDPGFQPPELRVSVLGELRGRGHLGKQREVPWQKDPLLRLARTFHWAPAVMIVGTQLESGKQTSGQGGQDITGMLQLRAQETNPTAPGGPGHACAPGLSCGAQPLPCSRTSRDSGSMLRPHGHADPVQCSSRAGLLPRPGKGRVCWHLGRRLDAYSFPVGAIYGQEVEMATSINQWPVSCVDV